MKETFEDILSVEMYERFLTGTQVRVWGPKIVFNMSFLFGRSAFYLRSGGRHKHFFTEVCVGSRHLALP